MEKYTEKNRYWLKLDKNFLQSPHVKIIKSMPNGKDYVLLYLELLLASVENVGHLKFTPTIPYNDIMLAALTDTNVDIVRNAVKIFEELGLMQTLDEGTIFLPEVAKMTGKRSESADRVAKHRALKKAEYEALLTAPLHVTNCNDNIDIEDIEDIEKKEEYRIYNNRYILEEDSENNLIQIDYDEFVSNYNKELYFLQKVIKISVKRRESIKAFVMQFSDSEIQKGFENVKNSKFLKGQVTDFKASFDWLININNFIKVLEGNYDKFKNENFDDKSEKLDDWEKRALRRRHKGGCSDGTNDV